MSEKDGIAKNWEVVCEEYAAWLEMREPLHQMLKDAKGLGEKLHKWHNLKTEFTRACPRTVAYGWAAVEVLALCGMGLGIGYWIATI